MNNNGVLQKSSPLFPIPSPLLQSNKNHHYFFTIQPPKPQFLSIHLKSPSSYHVFASKTPIKSEINVPETDDFDFEDEFEEEFEDDDEEDDEDEDEIVVPLRNMREWTKNKPLGFGEGKVYDTSIEDKLMEELEQSRAAQLANVTNLKNNPEDGNPNSKKGKLSKQKVDEVPPNGVRVRLVHLPKKKNIHRDLQAAFKPFSGITNIIPAVSGNEKTREPVCKGFGFVDFKSEKEATRFVNTFSTQPILFGKVQKQIKCEIMKPSPPNPAPTKPSVNKTTTSLPITNPVTEIPFVSYVEDSAFDKLSNGDDDLVSVTDEDNLGNLDDLVEEKRELEVGSEPSKKPKKVREKGKKTITAKKKGEKTPKLNIPGSANRLKMKEKALLSGVFSKYGGKSAMAVKETEVVADQVR